MINRKRIEKRLLDKGVPIIYHNNIIELLYEGLDIDIEPSSFELNGSKDFKIQLLNTSNEIPKENEVLLTSNFDIKIPGIDINQIRSIKIPELRLDTTDIFVLEIELFPFKIDNINLTKE